MALASVAGKTRRRPKRLTTHAAALPRAARVVPMDKELVLNNSRVEQSAIPVERREHGALT